MDMKNKETSEIDNFKNTLNNLKILVTNSKFPIQQDEDTTGGRRAITSLKIVQHVQL